MGRAYINSLEVLTDSALEDFSLDALEALKNNFEGEQAALLVEINKLNNSIDAQVKKFNKKSNREIKDLEEFKNPDIVKRALKSNWNPITLYSLKKYLHRIEKNAEALEPLSKRRNILDNNIALLNDKIQEKHIIDARQAEKAQAKADLHDPEKLLARLEGVYHELDTSDAYEQKHAQLENGWRDIIDALKDVPEDKKEPMRLCVQQARDQNEYQQEIILDERSLQEGMQSKARGDKQRAQYTGAIKVYNHRLEIREKFASFLDAAQAHLSRESALRRRRSSSGKQEKSEQDITESSIARSRSSDRERISKEEVRVPPRGSKVAHLISKHEGFIAAQQVKPKPPKR